jgi:hypothetical protein
MTPPNPAAQTLEACPFCGGKASLWSPRYSISADCGDAQVRCSVCEAEGPAVLCDMDDADAELHWPGACQQAIAAWNRRARPLESQGTPDWITVPREPTEAMARALEAAWDEDPSLPPLVFDPQESERLARAIIAALPHPIAGEKGE